MAKYLFYPTADKAQDGIWLYGHDTWGKKQADKYIKELHSHLQELADKRLFWHNLPDRTVIPQDLNIKAYFSRYGVHHIFFREFASGDIGIMSILRQSSDIPVRLRKDLSKITEKGL